MIEVPISSACQIGPAGQDLVLLRRIASLDGDPGGEARILSDPRYRDVEIVDHGRDVLMQKCPNKAKSGYQFTPAPRLRLSSPRGSFRFSDNPCAQGQELKGTETPGFQIWKSVKCFAMGDGRLISAYVGSQHVHGILKTA